MNRLSRARKYAERAVYLEIVSHDHMAAMANYTQAAVHLESALEIILCRIRTYAAKLETLRHYVAAPERWERISLPPSHARTADKRYVCEMEGLVVLGRHCGRYVDVGFPDVLRQLYQFIQIPSFGGSRTPSRGRHKSWKTVLLSGPAATGKHSLARALSSGIRVCSVSYVYVPELLCKPKHMLELAVRNIFDASAAVVPVVVILDRVDEICKPEAGHASKVISECIQEVLDDSDGNVPVRRPFYHIDSREKLNQRFVDLVKVSGVEPARCCFCIGEAQPEEETTPPLSSVSEVGPASPSTTPLFPVDVELQKAIAAMTKVLAQNSRPRPPHCEAAVRTSSRSSVRNCTIC
ncbi:hypothetical protein MTO96_015626 [Rhipicephalus appendiculatus]